MLKIEQHDQDDQVTQLLMGREVEGVVYYWTAAYLVDGLLIDTGCSYTAPELLEYLKGGAPRQVVNTHHHEDHVGANALIQRELGVTASAHPRAVPLIAQRPFLHPYQEMVWGCPDPAEAVPLTGVVSTPRFEFQVVETPGHCPDHVAFFEPGRGWCFCGDLFVSENQKTLRADEELSGIVHSLQKLLLLPGERLILFTSIGRVFPEGRAAIRAFLEHLEGARREVEALQARGLAAEEIRDSVFGRESSLAPLTGGHYSVLNLVRQLMAAPI